MAYYYLGTTIDTCLNNNKNLGGEMNLLNHIPDELLLTVDAMNTLNGGQAQDKIQFEKDEDAYRLRIKVPGAEKNSFKVFMNEDILTVVHLIAFDTLKKTTMVPRPVWNKKLPVNANIEGIYARFDNSSLMIDIPMNGYNVGESREIAIE